ncbi:AAA family ATPase [Kribbella sindirgiensis]|uniref:ATP-binding protein n=1 Tax=Kribbella sindirgiensis TaxID=1124744 RepID=A0A4R0J177_9ACTN|nr:ATP-binding protein [Kribbella sindirgiensis]TCC34885.1 ATP-binding protein [Kribbella sindirgiensis]
MPLKVVVGRSDFLGDVIWIASRRDVINGQVEQGSATLTFVSGDLGLGKTRLFEEFRRRAESDGVPSALVRPTEACRRRPYAALASALDPLAGALRGEMADFPPGLAPALLTLAPAIALGSCPAAEPRPQLFEAAVRELVTRLSYGRGLVLLIDDAHWADDASLDAPLSLSRTSITDGLRISLSYRPRQLSPRLTAAVENVTLSGVARMCRLSPLTVDESRRMIGDRRSARRRDRFARATS